MKICILCKKFIQNACGNRKYCEDCQDEGYNMQRRKKKLPPRKKITTKPTFQDLQESERISEVRSGFRKDVIIKAQVIKMKPNTQ